MSRRHKKVNRPFVAHANVADHRLPIERLLEKQQYKDALKLAKIALRQQDSAENRRFFVRAACLRTEQLADRGLLAEARDTFAQLSGVSTTDPDAADSNTLVSIASLAARLGLGGASQTAQARLEALPIEQHAALSTKLADLAVLRPALVAGTMPELEGAAAIRAALSALRDGDEPKCLELLQPISRSSPLADWRLFVRGLAAFERGDDAQARANWDRLAPDRAPRSIADKLQRLMPGPGFDAADVSIVEMAVFGDTVLDRLAGLQAAVVESDWRSALEMLPAIAGALRRIDVRLAHRLTEALLDPLAQHAGRQTFNVCQRLVNKFIRCVEPLPIDPRWNRFWAILWDGPQGDPRISTSYWRKYARDLDGVAEGLPVERHRIQAMVYRHIALMLRDQGSTDRFGPWDDPPGRPGDQQAGVVGALRESLRHDPSQRPTHQMLIDALMAAGDEPGVAAAAQGMLDVFPNDVGALRLLMKRHSSEDQPAEALPYLRRIRELQPLDESLSIIEFSLHVALARQAARKARWDEGRAEHALVADLALKLGLSHLLLVERAAFEFAAGQRTRAEALVAEAIAVFEEPTAVWLSLAISTRRYRLTKATVTRFEQAWKAASLKKTNGATAARIVGVFYWHSFDRPGRAIAERRRKEIMEYLRRTTRIQYREDELVRVCLCLESIGGEETLLEKLLRRGQKLFPRAAIFPHLAGRLELDKDAGAGDLRQARKLLKLALRLAEEPESTYAAKIPDIRRALLDVEDAERELFPLGNPFGAGGPNFDNFKEFFQRLFDNDFAPDDDEAAAHAPFRFAPRRRPSKKRAKS